MTAVVWRVITIRVLCGRYFGGWRSWSVGYAIAHPRLNPVCIQPPGSRPSDVRGGVHHRPTHTDAGRMQYAPSYVPTVTTDALRGSYDCVQKGRTSMEMRPM